MTDVSASLVRFAVAGEVPGEEATGGPVPEGLRSAVAALHAPSDSPAPGSPAPGSSATGSSATGPGADLAKCLAALGSSYPPADPRTYVLEAAAGLVRSGVHPLLAATAAVAGRRDDEGATEAAVRGCEVACRLAASLRVPADRLAVVGAALAGSTGTDGGLHALGLAATQATTVTASDDARDESGQSENGRGEDGRVENGRGKSGRDANEPGGTGGRDEVAVLRAALAAADGIEAALLGERGFTAPPQPLEGRRGLLALLAPEAEARELLDELGTRWLAEEVMGPNAAFAP